MNRSVALLMKGAAFLAVLLLFFPFVSLTDLVINRSLTGFSAVWHLGLIGCAGALGAFVSWTLARSKKQLRQISVILLLVLPGTLLAALYIFFLGFNLQSVSIVLFAALGYLAGVLLVGREFDEMLGSWVFYTGLIGYPASMALIWLYAKAFEAPYETGFLVAFFIAFFFLYAVVANQTNLNRMMDRRRYTHASLPKNIRIYNVVLVSVGFVFVLLGLVFKKQVQFLVQLLWEVIKGFGALLVFLWRGFLSLLEVKGMDDILPIPPDGPDQVQIMMRSVIEGKYPLISQIIITLLIFVILWVLYALRFQFLRFFRFVFYGAARFFKRIFKQILGKNSLGEDGAISREFEYYSDTLEDLDNTAGKLLPGEEQTRSFQEWRHVCRRFLRRAALAKDKPLEEGYRLILKWLTLYEVPIKPSDTTLEILKKAQQRVSIESLSDTTHAYNDYSYGGEVVDPDDWAVVAQTLTSMIKVK